MEALRRIAGMALGLGLVVLLSVAASKAAGSAASTQVWLPLHVPVRAEQYAAGSVPPLQYIYAKQPNQITFKLCAEFVGDGEVLLAYGGLGDGVEFSYSQWEWRCVTTETGWGGGSVGIPLDVYLIQRGKQPALMRHPSLFVSSE